MQCTYADGADPLSNDSPVMVIGEREKLTADGSTLALMRAFEETLALAARLVVVGYSFGDQHINTVIRNWMGADDSRTITILDPGWPAPERVAISPDTSLDLRDALRFVGGYSLAVADGRVVVIKEPAGKGLARALTEVPLRKVTTEITVVACLDERPYLQITNRGYDLEFIDLIAGANTSDATYQSVGNLRTTPEGSGATSVRFEGLGHGESVQAFFDVLPEGSGHGHLWISGRAGVLTFPNMSVSMSALKWGEPS